MAWEWFKVYIPLWQSCDWQVPEGDYWVSQWWYVDSSWDWEAVLLWEHGVHDDGDGDDDHDDDATRCHCPPFP
eukprot:3500390-Karenia_brevis.AAC.1